MKKFIIGVILATSISAVAMAADVSLVTDTARNTTQGTTTTEFGIEAGVNNFNFSLLPTYDWDNEKVSTTELFAGYNFDLNLNKDNSVGISPYGKLLMNTDTADDKIIGLKTKYKF
jgi:opacity protein-like surface antigen